MKQKTTNRKALIFTIILVVLVIAGAVFAYATVQRNNQSTTPPNTSNSTEPEAGDANDTSGSISSPDADDTPVQTPPNTVAPQTPTGTFVSNHHPNLSGSPSPNAMNSTCTTTSGVMCNITFTKDGKTLSLDNKQADANGSVVWNWNLQDLGFTTGTWTVTAIATNGDKTASTVDSMTLEVQP